MLVGEALGRWEMVRGGPFAGRAGTKFGECLTVGGILRSDHIVTNVVKCRPIQWYPCELCDDGFLGDGTPCPECDGKGEYPRLNPGTGDYYNTTPDWKMISECTKRYLMEEMREFTGDLIVPLGDVGLYATTGMRGITKLRGSILDSLLCSDCGEEVISHEFALDEVPF